MRAEEIMTTAVLVARPGTTVHEAAVLLTQNAVTSLPVLDDEERVIGIVSEVDLVRDRLPHDDRSHLRREPPQADPARLVREVMSDVVVCMSRHADIADIAALMVDHRVRAVPIVDGGTLVGIVSRRDLLRTLLRDDAAIKNDVLARLADYSVHADGQVPWEVEVSDGVVTVRGHYETDEQERIVEVLARNVAGVLRVHCLHHAFGSR